MLINNYTLTKAWLLSKQILTNISGQRMPKLIVDKIVLLNRKVQLKRIKGMLSHLLTLNVGIQMTSYFIGYLQEHYPWIHSRSSYRDIAIHIGKSIGNLRYK